MAKRSKYVTKDMVVHLLAEVSQEWRESAACRDAGNPDLWFSSDYYEQQSAKRICEECPVRVECLEFAVTTRQDFGIWGGTSPGEREKIKSDRRTD